MDECAAGNGGCEDVCTNTGGSFSCACAAAGHSLAADGRACVAPCSAPNVPQNGAVDKPDAGQPEGSVATYACDAGFKLVGTRTVTCTSGAWSSGEPTCEAPANCKEALDNGVTASGSVTLKSGVVATCRQDVDGGGWTLLKSSAVAQWSQLNLGSKFEYLYFKSTTAWRVQQPGGAKWTAPPHIEPGTFRPRPASSGRGARGTRLRAPTGGKAAAGWRREGADGRDRYQKGGTVSSFYCGGSSESPSGWAVGCSRGGGNQYKVLPYYTWDAAAGEGTVCQDQPNAFSGGACVGGVKF